MFGALLVALAACTPPLDVRGADVPAHVVEALREQAVPLVEELRADFGDSDCRPITITLVPEMNNAHTLDPPWHLPSWAAGAAQPNERRIVVGITSQGRVQDRVTTLHHELAHVIARSAAGGKALPRWLDEGIARTAAGEHGAVDLHELARARVADRLLPLTALEEGFPAEQRSAALAYAEAGRAVSLLRAHDDQAIARLLALIKEGEHVDDALRAVSGRATWQLDLDVKRSVSSWAALAIVGIENDLAMALCGVAVAVFGVRARRRQLARLQAMDDDDDDPRRRLVLDVQLSRFTVAPEAC